MSFGNAFAALKRRSSAVLQENSRFLRFVVAGAPAPVGMTNELMADKVKVKSDRQECPSHTSGYSFAWRRRRALVITETELKLMAAAAKMGLSSRPKKG